MNESDLKRKQLISLIKKYGFPEEFGCILADELHTEKQMKRMIGIYYKESLLELKIL